VVPTESLLPHERHDAQRTQPLAERLRENGVLHNPPAVAPLDSVGLGTSSHYVVLDGANRSTAAALLKLPHMLVQVVDYEDPALQLTTWHHAVTGLGTPELLAAIRGVPGLVVTDSDLRRARAVLARREALAYLALPGGEIFTLHGGDDLQSRNEILNLLVSLYQDRGKVNRTTADHAGELANVFRDLAGLVVFPHFDPAEIAELARGGETLPAGITRFLIPGRALRLNIPLSLLEDTTRTLDEKNDWLKFWMREKVAAGKVRFYQESTYLFDE
jgi:hypothetical protein